MNPSSGQVPCRVRYKFLDIVHRSTNRYSEKASFTHIPYNRQPFADKHMSSLVDCSITVSDRAWYVKVPYDRIVPVEKSSICKSIHLSYATFVSPKSKPATK